MAPDELLERFTRGDTSRNSEGNGLGLSIAKSLTDLQNEISLEKNREMIGKVLPVFVQGQSKTNAEMFSGRTEGNKLVHFKAAPQLIGKTVPMKITDATFFALFAEPFDS